jgi:hypothetical protein
MCARSMSSALTRDSRRLAFTFCFALYRLAEQLSQPASQPASGDGTIRIARLHQPAKACFCVFPSAHDPA